MNEKSKRTPQRINQRRLLAFILIIFGLAFLVVNISGFSATQVIGEAGRTVGETAGSLGQAIGEAAGQFGSSVGNFFGNFGRTMGEFFGSLGRGFGRTAANLWPLVLIVIGLVLILRNPRQKVKRQPEFLEDESAL
ncbi:MAG: hypothetical protein K8L99_16050 [Anaerolineae bacterium]|nr:hypothetical protein [Anaerolineae bacterium]